MTVTNDLFPETLLVSRDGGRVYTDSLRVAERFGKRHAHVLRAIKNLLDDLIDVESDSPKLGCQIGERDAFSLSNFGQSAYQNERGKTYSAYQLSHDGFALLAMRFTGKAALEWQVKFLAAFRSMERQIAEQKVRETAALYHVRPRWKPIAENNDLPRTALIQLTGHKSPGSITACRRRMREVGLLES